MSFDYGNKLPDGQHEHHPTNLEGEAVRPYRNTYSHNTCGERTTCPPTVAETYQKNPKYYNRTFCVGCKDYFPVSEFKWKDGTTLGE